MQDQMSTKLEQIPSSCNRNSSTCFTLQILKNPNFEQKKRNQSSKTEAQFLKPSTVKTMQTFQLPPKSQSPSHKISSLAIQVSKYSNQIPMSRNTSESTQNEIHSSTTKQRWREKENRVTSKALKNCQCRNPDVQNDKDKKFKTLTLRSVRPRNLRY